MFITSYNIQFYIPSFYQSLCLLETNVNKYTHVNIMTFSNSHKTDVKKICIQYILKIYHCTKLQEFTWCDLNFTFNLKVHMLGMLISTRSRAIKNIKKMTVNGINFQRDFTAINQLIQIFLVAEYTHRHKNDNFEIVLEKHLHQTIWNFQQ